MCIRDRPYNEEITEMNVISETNNSNMAVLNSIGSFTQPNDTYYYNQWNMNMINASYWWQYGLDTKNVKIGLIDSGSPDRHPDITQNIAPGVDYTGTVSYTHLDVYKRQPLLRIIVDTSATVNTPDQIPFGIFSVSS